MNYNKLNLLLIPGFICCAISSTSNANTPVLSDFDYYRTAPHSSSEVDESNSFLAKKMASVIPDIIMTQDRNVLNLLKIATNAFDPKNILDLSLRKYDVALPYWVARTDISIDVQKGSKTTFDIETIQPLYQTNATKRNTCFIQARWGRRNSDDTVNIGFGYRRLLVDESWLFGANVFYDTTLKAYHKRIGVGVEAIGKYVTFRGNYYKGVSDERTISHESDFVITEKALNGYDVGVEMPLPKMPWAHIRFDHYRWKGHKFSDVHGYTVRLHCNLTKNLHLEFGRSDDAENSSRMFAKAYVNFGTNSSYEYNAFDNFFSEKILPGRNLFLHTLDKVKRHQDVVIERALNGSYVVIGRGT